MMRLLLALAASLCLVCCSPGPDASPRAIALETCRLPGVDAPAKCGTYEVWEDREAKAGRRIKLDLAVIPAKMRAKEPDPIVIFAGGPGQGAVSLASQVMPLFAKLNDARDVVFIDQRGTGNSAPLDCPEEEQPLQQLFEDSLPEKMVARCLAQIQADPRLYTTSIAVEDIDEVLGVLGYAKVDVWGGSYGTRMALEYLRRHGERVRTAVLDGVAPATMKLPLSFVADGDAALKRLIDACEREERCGKVYPSLRDTIAKVRAQLARHPVRAAIQDPRTGERETIDVNENVFLSGLFRPLYVAELASLLPLGITAAAEGDFNPLLAQNLEFADDVSENLSIGMHLSVVCAEDIPRITPEDLAKLSGAFFGRSLVDDFVRACSVWPRVRRVAARKGPRGLLRPGALGRARAHSLGRHRSGDAAATRRRGGRDAAQRAPFRRAVPGPRREPARLRAAPHRILRARRQRAVARRQMPRAHPAPALHPPSGSAA